jgi:WD40 repeat protein
VAFSPDETRIVTGSEDRTARVWPLLQNLPELAQVAWPRIMRQRILSEAQMRRLLLIDDTASVAAAAAL